MRASYRSKRIHANIIEARRQHSYRHSFPALDAVESRPKFTLQHQNGHSRLRAAREQFIHRPPPHIRAPYQSLIHNSSIFDLHITQVRTSRTDRILFHECERAKGAKGAKAGAGLRLSLPSSERVLPRAGNALKDVLNLERAPALAPARPSPVSTIWVTRITFG